MVEQITNILYTHTSFFNFFSTKYVSFCEQMILFKYFTIKSKTGIFIITITILYGSILKKVIVIEAKFHI